MLKISHLTASVDGQEILSDVNLEIKSGEVHVLLGPNGSGKTSLAKVIMGDPHFTVEQGEIEFDKHNITQEPMNNRVKLGLGLSFQDPPAIKGVKLSELIDLISHDGKNQAHSDFDLPAVEQLLSRDVNHKFSGGEKKISEIVQLASMDPKMVIFDELDAGLDLKNLKTIVQLIKDRFISKQTPLLFITHSGMLVDGLTPDFTHVMLDKKIICNSKDYVQVKQTIQEYGYERCKRCEQRQN